RPRHRHDRRRPGRGRCGGSAARCPPRRRRRPLSTGSFRTWGRRRPDRALSAPSSSRPGHTEPAREAIHEKGAVMTERKPPGMSWETWPDRQIREGMERGEFDGLPGHGKPLADLNRPRDDLWWVKDKLRRESVSFLPPTLVLRKDVELAREQIAAAPS